MGVEWGACKSYSVYSMYLGLDYADGQTTVLGGGQHPSVQGQFLKADLPE